MIKGTVCPHDEGWYPDGICVRCGTEHYTDYIAELENKVKGLEKPRLDPCPHCQCSELLCGHPNNCSSEEANNG